MSAIKTRKTGPSASDKMQGEVWQLVAVLSALEYQLLAIEHGDVHDSTGEVHNARRVSREVKERLSGLGEIFSCGVDVRVTHAEAQQLIEALR